MSVAEHEKLKQVQPKSQVIGDFLVWCGTKGMILAEYDDKDYWDRMWPVRKSKETLLAEYFDIDLKKLENEKQAILTTLQVVQ